MNKEIRGYFQPAFLICVAVLAVSGAGMSIAVHKLGIISQKDPLPMKKPLSEMNDKALGPYRVVSKQKITDEEVIKSLGTEEYLQWQLEDTNAAQNSPVRFCSLFITYYGLPGTVLHVPEECYTGSGNQRLSSVNVKFKTGSGEKDGEIEGIYVIFVAGSSKDWQNESQFGVMYFFKVNGEYSSGREGARLILGKNIRGRHSYFSKVEWKFFNAGFGSAIYPDKETAIKASGPLLGVIVPILENEHWPQWSK